MAATIEIFISYAHEDELLRQELEKQLKMLQRQGLINLWRDQDISAGTEQEREINIHLNRAQVILLLISPDFIASDYCYSKEMKQVMERHERGEARVIPIILRPVYWQGTPFGKLRALPTNGKPVTDPDWYSQDRAFFNVEEGIRQAIEQLTTSDTNEITSSPELQTSRESVASSYPSHQELERTIPSEKRGFFSFKKRKSVILVISIIVITILFTSSVIIISNYSSISQFDKIYKNATNGKPIDLFTSDNTWVTNATCGYTKGLYQVTASNRFYANCITSFSPSNDFAFEVTITINKGDAAGLSFGVSSSSYYAFTFCRSGICTPSTAALFYVVGQNRAACVGPNPPQCGESSAHITDDLNAQNTLTVVVLNNTIYMYINKFFFYSVPRNFGNDENGIGVVAYEGANPTVVTVSSAKIWLLP